MTDLVLDRRALLRLTLAGLASAPLLSLARADDAAAPGVEVARACNAFGLDLHRALGGADDRFASPFSVATALGMTLLGARGETAAELSRALRMTTDASHDGLGRLGADLPAVSSATRLFADRSLTLLEPFGARCRRAYGAEVGRVDFARAADAARREVNGWVAERTKDKVRDLLNPGDVDAATRLVLASAVHFKAAWARPFDAGATAPGPFRLAGGEQVEVPLMRSVGHCRVADVEGATALELDYAGDRIAFLALIPTGEPGLPALERDLTAERLDAAVAALRPIPARVTLPRFRIEDRADLVRPLESMGVSAAFGSSADLSGLNGARDLFVSKVIHKTFVDVNEAGTEAAAATAVVTSRSGPPRDPRDVRADRPFLFMIRDRRSGAVLFLGRLTDPR